MKHHLLYPALLCLTALTTLCAGEPFKGTFAAQGYDIKLVLNLYDETIEVPGMEMFGPLNGYMKGKDLYCTWYVSTIRECDTKKAVIHVSNDLGSETQPIELTWENDSIMNVRELEGAVLKKVVGKKLVKLPTTFKFKRE